MKNLMIQLLPKKLIKYLRIVKLFLDYSKAILYRIGLEKKTWYPFSLRFFPKNCEFNIDLNDKETSWGLAFGEYLTGCQPSINLVWAATPIPGNYGDWLSPYVMSRITGRSIKFMSEVTLNRAPHIVALGSIISCANKNSIVLGAGAGSKNETICNEANFVSVRGKYTGDLIGYSGACYGDLGFIISDVYTPKNNESKSTRFALVRHINHIDIDMNFSIYCDEISIKVARKADIEKFIDELHFHDVVLTSAMHCFITCISYKIKVVLVDFSNSHAKVPGDGMKYVDALSGVDLKEVMPVKINSEADFKNVIDNIELYIYKEQLRNDSVISIKNSIFRAVSDYDYKIKEI